MSLIRVAVGVIGLTAIGSAVYGNMRNSQRTWESIREMTRMQAEHTHELMRAMHPEWELK